MAMLTLAAREVRPEFQQSLPTQIRSLFQAAKISRGPSRWYVAGKEQEIVREKMKVVELQ
jgi:hypothetical protein